MKLYKFIIILTFLSHAAFSDDIHRYGTTAANFLEIGIGSASGGMGEAYVAVANDLSAVYWNPAGLSSLKGVGIQFMIQPWVVNINTIFAAGAVNVPRIGTFALSLTQIGYGQMDVTTLAYQEGTGEQYTANELALTFGGGRAMLNTFWLESEGFEEKKSPCSHTSRYFASICSGLYVFSMESRCWIKLSHYTITINNLTSTLFY